MNVGPIIEQLLAGHDLLPEQAEGLMDYLISGQADDVRIAGILIAMKAKGATGAELASFARAMKRVAIPLEHDLPQVLDTCGTGGGIPSFNISTATAIIIAAAGGKVAKHGNRGVTSACGSVDVLEALGVKFDLPPDRNREVLSEVGLAFLFAPSHHSAMRHVGPARKALGTRTIFNQLGPLANPANANRQMIGVYEPQLLQPMAEALRDLGCDRGLVVHGADGMDEVSPCTSTFTWRVWRGKAEHSLMDLRDLGLEPISPTALTPGETAQENADILREAISDAHSIRFAAILPSAATALWVAGLADLPIQGVDLARELVSSGRALRKLEEFVQATNR